MNKTGKKLSFAKEKDKTKQEDEPLNSEGVHAILSAYKDARSTCLNLKNSPSLVKMFTPEAIMLLEMVGDGRLKYIKDETLLKKYDEVVAKRLADYGSECEPYKTRETLRLLDYSALAYINEYNESKTSTTADLEVAAAAMRGDHIGLQILKDYDDLIMKLLNEAFKVTDLASIKAMYLSVTLQPMGKGTISDKMMEYVYKLLKISSKVDDKAMATKEAKDLVINALNDYLTASVNQELGSRMEVATKAKGFAVTDWCDQLMKLTEANAKKDDPFANFKDSSAAQVGESSQQGAARLGGGNGKKGGAGRGGAKPMKEGGEKPLEKPPYFDGLCKHCNKKGHMKKDCRFWLAEQNGDGGGRGGGQGQRRQVAALDFDYENLTKQQFDQMKKAAIKNQRK
jgi:hypothetical protein